MASDACLTAAIRLLVAEGYIVVERNLQEPERPDKVWRVVDIENSPSPDLTTRDAGKPHNHAASR